MVAKRIIAADLFCGAGGFSTGLSHAAKRLGHQLDLTAVDHWDRAIETHSTNHPKATHFCQRLADINPKQAIPGGKLDLLIASPECIHHSVARGGKPVNDQSRATAYCVHRWCAALAVRQVLIENVPEFQTWGPLDVNGRPLASGKGQLFAAYIQTFRAMGYRVEWRVLNAGDFGAATTRRRLFIRCVKGKLPIRWPEPTHQPDPQPSLFETLPRWREARTIIDWSRRGKSIFGRHRPLASNTLARIEAGLRKFGGANAVPFLISFNGKPEEERRRHDLDKPLPTQHCSNRFGLVTQSANSLLTRDHMALVEPFLMHVTHQGGGRVYATDKPLPCVTGANRGEQTLVEPFYGYCQADPASDPLRTVMGPRGVDQPQYDILFRMLQPNELKQAIGFAADYTITGNRGEQVKQIGNAVCVEIAAALTHAMLEDAT